MYIRCGVCQAATWIETLEPGVAALSISCTECGQEYSLLAAGELGTSSDEQYQRAREYAEFNGIDLPSAYSVMLGFMTLAEAQTDRDRRVEKSAEAPRFTESDDEDGLPYDEGFAAAVSAGFLSVQQAVDRGNRRELATRIARRHDMPLELALKVADNRMSLAEARLRRPPVVQVAVSERPATPSHKLLLLGFAAVILVTVGVQGWVTFHRSDAPPAPVVVTGQEAEQPQPLDRVARAIATTTVQTDKQGRVVRVAGPDPTSVLIAFCKSTLAGRFKPVELTRAMPALPGMKLGVFRDQDRLERLLAIRIRRDADSRSWVAGNGREPVPTSEPPIRPPNSPRIPVVID